MAHSDVSGDRIGCGLWIRALVTVLVVVAGAIGRIVSIATNDHGDIFMADFRNSVVHKVSLPAAP